MHRVKRSMWEQIGLQRGFDVFSDLPAVTIEEPYVQFDDVQFMIPFIEEGSGDHRNHITIEVSAYLSNGFHDPDVSTIVIEIGLAGV